MSELALLIFIYLKTYSTYLFNSYINIQNILLEKKLQIFPKSIELRSTVRQAGIHTTWLQLQLVQTMK